MSYLSTMEIRRTTFEENSASIASTIMINSNTNNLNTIEDCIFTKNSGEGLIQIYESNLKITNTTFTENFSEESPSIKII